MSTELKNNFVGGLDLDTSYYELPKNVYVDALNITRDGVQQSQDRVVTNIISNRFVPYNKPAGTNATIGAKADVLRNRVFEFMWNSQGYHSILIYDNATRVRTKLIENLTDTNGEDVLQFTRYNRILHVDIIYRDETEGDLLFWTDGNVSPRKLNVKHIEDGDYTYIKVPFIEVAKRPPLSPATCVYGSDASRNSNSLRKKLIEATYWFSCDDFEKTTPTTYSKVPLPIGYYGSDNDIDNTKNNFITITVETGDENVTDIEIAVRFNEGNTWGDFVLVVSLNKAQLSIPDNITYDYLFYNDGVYPPLDVAEVTQLFDWVPRKAKSQCSANGNTIEFGAITENYDNYPISDIDVTLTVENKTNVPPDTDPPSLTYTYNEPSNHFFFTVNGNVPTGTFYQVQGFDPLLGMGVIVAEYTSLPGDTVDDVAIALYASISVIYQVAQAANEFTFVLPTGGTVTSVIVTSPGGGGSGSDISTEKTWLYDANYLFGQGYKDPQGRLMPGVTTLINPVDTTNDYLVTTPSFSLDGSDVQTPVISAEVNHLPYPGSQSYAWVRRRMTYADFLFYMTCDFQDPGDGFYYFCLANIESYKAQNSQFIYATAPITSDSRIKIVAGISGGGYDGSIYAEDYEIVGQETKTLSTGGTPADDKIFIKVKAPTTPPATAYQVNMLVFVYTPMSNPTDATDSVYYEWGEEYRTYTGYTIPYTAGTGTFTVGEVITGGTSGATAIVVGDSGTELGVSDISGTFSPGETITGATSSETATLTSVSAGIVYHRGMTQDQTSFQPATFSWAEGDVYFHLRTMYNSILASPGPPFPEDTVSLMDANYSDFFPSAVNDNGRGLTIEVNARETYFPATIRFSLEYQQNTNINQTNRFFFNNFIDVDRSFGDIFKMSIKDRYIRIGQRFKIGLVPIFNQISKDSQNNTILAATDVLLNPVQYYVGDYGVGTAPAAWVDYNNSSYFFDNIRGIWCRLSQDGITPISVIYKINSWASTYGPPRTGDSTIIGVYDSKSNNCIFSFEATADLPAATLAFDEEGNSFEGFLSYHPEMMCTLGTLLIAWKNGDLWTFDGDTYNNFFGVQYPSSITPVWNEKSAVKKVFNAISYQSNDIWESPENGDVLTSMINPQTELPQISQLKTRDYVTEENVRYAAFLRDANSMSDARLALCEGDFLNGVWIRTKLICPSSKSSKLLYLSNVYINNQPSPRNF